MKASTGWAFVVGTAPWEATIAAGAIAVGADAPFASVIAAATVVHGSMCLFWTGALRSCLPRSRPMAWRVVAGGVSLAAVVSLLTVAA